MSKKLKLVKIGGGMGPLIQVKPFAVNHKLGEVKEYSDEHAYALLSQYKGLFEEVKAKRKAPAKTKDVKPETVNTKELEGL